MNSTELDMVESTDQTQDAFAFWNSRAKLGQETGTRDLILKQLEINAISNYVCDGMRILDAGCGNGMTAIHIASLYDVHVVGFDFADGMIKAATVNAANSKLKGSVDFRVGDIRNIPATRYGKFDLVYTERALINLPDWPAQKNSILDLTNLLASNGIYVMCENSQDGLDKVNIFRKRLGLDIIDPPWHNRYFKDFEIDELTIPEVGLEKIEYFTSTYYLLSRVVNACLADQEGIEPVYDSPVNQLALQLPPVGTLGQTRIWLWRKIETIK